MSVCEASTKECAPRLFSLGERGTGMNACPLLFLAALRDGPAAQRFSRGRLVTYMYEGPALLGASGRTGGRLLYLSPIVAPPLSAE
eukprot:4349847-Prymnesium_polylepis.1